MAPAAKETSSRKFTTAAQFTTEPMFKQERKFTAERGLWPPEESPEPGTDKTPLSLSERLKDGLEKYGGVALATWMVLFLSTWLLFYVFLNTGIDAVAVMKRLGFDLSGLNLKVSARVAAGLLGPQA
jgi:hypothetical protein